MLRTRLKYPLAAVFTAAALAPAAAHASPQQTSIMMDDDQLVYRDDSTSARTLQRMKSLGVDTVRVTLLWEVAARDAYPSATEIKKAKGKKKTALKKQRARFKAANPATYPVQNWDRYDSLVRKATELGIRVYFNITGPGPSWGHEKAPKSQKRNQRTWKPKAGQYKRFVQAVGKRYSGTYKDENATKTALPRVSFWSLWNEPNQAGWLSPQWEQVGSKRVPTSPQLYRTLHQVGYKALVSTGHGGDIILIAETAPLGSSKQTSRSPMFPGKFLRELVCVKDNFTKYTGRDAKLRACGDLKKRGNVLGTGYAHHPYTKNIAPTVKPSNPDAFTIANATEMTQLLDRLSVVSGGGIPNNLPLLVTEFGFETNPPDPFSGIAPTLQAKFNTQGEYLGWSNPRIAAMAQFLLRDVPPVAGKPKTSKSYWFTYQSGLFDQNGLPKLSAVAYAMPFIVFPGAVDTATGYPTARVWGQLRFLRNGAPGGPSPGSVVIQYRPTSTPNGPWSNLDPIPVDPMGFYQAPVVAPVQTPVEWRAAFFLPGAATPAQTSLASTGG